MLDKLKENIVNVPNYKDKNFLLTVSGGMDSMGLLFAFKELNLTFGVAHCNFKLRDNESDLDEELVAKNSPKNKFYCKRFNTTEYQESNNISIQMAARELRYSWFNELANEYNYDYIVTAHHLNDQIETFFLNLARGTGIEGLTGIKEFNGIIFRPLLNVSREEIEKYVTENNIPYREDSSNSSVKYKRNKIRHELIPILKELNTSFEATMLNNFKIIESTNSIYTDTVNSFLSDNLIKTKGTEFYINIKKLLSNKNAQHFLFEYIRKFNFNSTQSLSIFETINKEYVSGKKFTSNSHLLLIDRDDIIISPTLNSDEIQIEIKKNDKIVTKPIHLSFYNVPNTDINISPNPNLAYLDLAKISFPLTLRKWEQGDYFYPLGMTKKKKLSDFFIDKKLSLIEKNNTYVLTSNNEIIWVVGQRISNSYKTTTETKDILLITLKE